MNAQNHISLDTVIIVAWCFAAIFGDWLLTRGHFFYGMLAYAACAVPSYVVFHRRQFGLVTVLWAAVSVPVGLLCSVYVCKEHMTARRIVGALLAIVAIAIAD